MKKEIRILRKKLPAKGYIKLIQAEAKKTSKVNLTQDQVSNFFSESDERKVSETAQDAIIDAAKKVIQNIEKTAEARRKRAALA